MNVLASIRTFVGEVARTAALCPERAYDLRVAVSEACANAIEHTFGARLTSPSPRGSAPSDSPSPSSSPTASSCGTRAQDDRAHRGMGLPLMVQLTDELIFRRLGGRGTEVVLGMLLSQG